MKAIFASCSNFSERHIGAAMLFVPDHARSEGLLT